MEEFEVNCAIRLDGGNANEHITHIGNTISQWRLTRQAAISRIEWQQEAYYTVDKSTGKRAYIGVVRESGKLPYLRTCADGKWNDDLLALAECRPDCELIW